MNQKDENFAVVTGLLMQKTRNADSPGQKRPVLDIEVICTNGKEPVFEAIPVVIYNPLLARCYTGYKPGDILTIRGALHRSRDGETFLEAQEIAKSSSVRPTESFPIEYMVSRMEMMQMSPRFNLYVLFGTITDIQETEFTLCVQRKNYSKDDLTVEDSIVITSPIGTDLQISVGDQVCCIGECGTKIYLNTLRKLV